MESDFELPGMWENADFEGGETDVQNEVCKECGRSYLLWIAPSELFEAVNGSRVGCLCLDCFTIKAAAKDINIIWVPHVSTPEGDWAIMTGEHQMTEEWDSEFCNVCEMEVCQHQAELLDAQAAELEALRAAVPQEEGPR